MSCVTNPYTPERGQLETCECCGQVYHINNGPDCDCGRGHDAL
jgi:hypothetical protein